MPELPEVETLRRMLEPAMQGARFRRVIVNRPDLRIPFPARFVERLRGRIVRAIERRGKYLAMVLSSGESLIVHLGMSGWFHVAAVADHTREPDAHDHVVFVMSSGQRVVFNDPRRFGLMDLAPGPWTSHPALRALGPEPLSAAFDATSLARACRGRRTLKAALLDQHVVAGLGNIYASEALHHARLSPQRRASTLATRSGAPRVAAGTLAASVKAVLLAAIRRRESPHGSARFRVYEREGAPCRRQSCSGVIHRIVQSGRSTYYCPECQR